MIYKHPQVWLTISLAVNNRYREAHRVEEACVNRPLQSGRVHHHPEEKELHLEANNKRVREALHKEREQQVKTLQNGNRHKKRREEGNLQWLMMMISQTSHSEDSQATTFAPRTFNGRGWNVKVAGVCMQGSPSAWIYSVGE